MVKLKILIYSPFFLPRIGGLENTVVAVALAYHQAGHQVKVITQTRSDSSLNLPYEVYRNPNIWQILKLFYWCDVVHQPNISLKGIWPLLFLRRTYCISHHTTNYDIKGNINWIGKLKYYISSKAHNASCSSYTNSLLYKKGIVINSPYNEHQFFKMPEIKKDKDLVFLGRLVSDKGCVLVLEALEILSKRAKEISLTVIGNGPELTKLQGMSLKLGISNQVEFKGALKGSELSKELNKHQIMVVPSVWEEPFGKVAVEGMACGCKVIVSDSGGLKEAIGDYGWVFKKNNPVDLANKILEAMTKEYSLEEENKIAHHLQNFTTSFAGKKYVSWIENAYENDRLGNRR